MQAAARGMAARKEARNRRNNRAAVKIQSAVRMHRDRVAFLRTRKAAITIQAAWRGRQDRIYAHSIACATPPSLALLRMKNKCKRDVFFGVSQLVAQCLGL